jgi:acetyl esterase/lipase
MFSSKQYPIVIGLVLLIVVSLIAGCAGASTPAAAPTKAPAATPTTAAQPAAPAGMPPLPAGAVPPAGGLPAGALSAPVITPTLSNIVYANTSSAQVLDLYMPEGTGPFPLVVNIHPGGFFTGDKSMIPVTPTLAMLAAGYAVASVNYRLSGEAPFPAAAQDVKAAVRFLRANAAKYHLNPDQIAAFGQSAGGNLASMLGTSSDIAAFDDPALGNAGISSRVQAVINWFGPNDFSQMDEQAKAQGCAASDQTHSAADSPESKYLGAAVPTVPELVKKANPMSYITPDDPPFFIQKGDQDCTIAIENTKMLADALSEAKMDVQYELLKGVGHGDGFGSTTPVFESDANSQKLVDFLKAKLKK